jgi:hypothetical protein
MYQRYCHVILVFVDRFGVLTSVKTITEMSKSPHYLFCFTLSFATEPFKSQRHIYCDVYC